MVRRTFLITAVTTLVLLAEVARAVPEDEVRAAAIAAAAAIRGEDLAALKAYVIADEGQMRLWQATLKHRAALRELSELTAALNAGPLEEFGMRGPLPLRQGELRPEQLREAKVEIGGERATLTEVSPKHPQATFTHELWRVGGRWKLFRAAKPPGGPDADAVARMREQDTGVIRKIAEKVRAGAYVRGDDVSEALLAALRRERGFASEDQPNMIGAGIPSVVSGGVGDVAAARDAAVPPPQRGMLSPATGLFDQLLYENLMVDALPDVAARLRGSDAARARRLAVADEQYRAEKAELRSRWGGGTAPAAARDVSKDGAAPAASSGGAAPDVLLARRQRQATTIAEMVEVARRHRKAAEAILTPDQRRAWNAAVVRTRMEAKIKGSKISTGGKQALEAAILEAADKVAQLPEPRDAAGMDRATDAVWEAARAKITGTE
jgi:hypothetical protein